MSKIDYFYILYTALPNAGNTLIW